MKSIKYVTTGIIIFIVIIIYKTTIVDCDGCGGCSYSNFEGIVIIDSIKFDLKTDSIDYCILKSNTSKIQFYFDKHDIYSLNSPLKPILIKDPKTNFFLKGSHITKGSCVPYNIDTIYYIKK